MDRLQARGIAAGVVQKAPDRFDRDRNSRRAAITVDLRAERNRHLAGRRIPGEAFAVACNVGGQTGRAATQTRRGQRFRVRQIGRSRADEMASLAKEGVI